MRRFILSGGPHAGKSTLLEALKAKFPDAHFIPEPATEVITRELAKQQVESDYMPKVPWHGYKLFAPLVFEEAVQLEQNVPQKTEIVFQDRSLIDTIAYLRLNHITDYQDETWKLANNMGYTAVFFCEPVGGHEITEVRRENSSEAEDIHNTLLETYRDSKLPLIDLPAVNVGQRVEMISKYMQSL